MKPDEQQSFLCVSVHLTSVENYLKSLAQNSNLRSWRIFVAAVNVSSNQKEPERHLIVFILFYVRQVWFNLYIYLFIYLYKMLQSSEIIQRAIKQFRLSNNLKTKRIIIYIYIFISSKNKNVFNKRCAFFILLVSLKKKSTARV